ncbi:hypothetical protein LXL04_029481 [Taraxacum kok-saghyz]
MVDNEEFFEVDNINNTSTEHTYSKNSRRVLFKRKRLIRDQQRDLPIECGKMGEYGLGLVGFGVNLTRETDWSVSVFQNPVSSLGEYGLGLVGFGVNLTRETDRSVSVFQNPTQWIRNGFGFMGRFHGFASSWVQPMGFGFRSDASFLIRWDTKSRLNRTIETSEPRRSPFSFLHTAAISDVHSNITGDLRSLQQLPGSRRRFLPHPVAVPTGHGHPFRFILPDRLGPDLTLHHSSSRDQQHPGTLPQPPTNSLSSSDELLVLPAFSPSSCFFPPSFAAVASLRRGQNWDCTFRLFLLPAPSTTATRNSRRDCRLSPIDCRRETKPTAPSPFRVCAVKREPPEDHCHRFRFPSIR